LKTKLLLSILLFGAFYQASAQNVLQAMKPRPADYEYLSAPDSLGVRHQLLMPDIANHNKNSKVNGAIPRLPYPIIFIHGLNSNDLIWGNTTDTNLMYNFFQSQNLTYGGKFDFNLNFDGNNAIANKSFWPTPNADIAFYTSTAVAADYYFVNFDVGSDGAVYPGGILSTNVLSNQSAIAKQGIALKTVIQKVLSLTGRDKVILMGHSMGGLAAREYLQNSSNWQIDGQHHIAKLITTGTPHGGYTGTNIQLVTGIDGQSEAYRDLRKSYSWTGYDGVYLYGGTENSSIIKNILLSPFYNVDVNCNGIDKDNTNIIGLNQRQWRTEIDYSYIVGICTNCEGLQLNIGGDGDGIVRSENANLSNFTTQLPEPKNEFIYKASAITIKGLHSDLPQAISVNMQGLDEPNEYSLAYGVDFGKYYKGFTTIQPINGYPDDYDDYKFTLNYNADVVITMANPSSNSIYFRFVNASNQIISSLFTIGANSNSQFTQTLPPGQYYLEIIGKPNTTSYLYPYTFIMDSFLSTDNFETNNSLNLFPNPTTSKVFFDNTNSNFKEVAVYNDLGQKVATTSFTSAVQNQEVDMSTLSTGIYVLKFSDGKTSKSAKVIKQ
jgi:pimeloyl-ACP methyl ester carboxylesterase